MAIKRILGIDPGSRITGIGIIDFIDNNKTPNCIYAGCIKLGEENMSKRLGVLYFEVKNIVAHYQPNEVAIEQVFVNKNPSSALKLGQARGVAIAASVSRNLPIFEYAPRQIKQAVTGFGQAQKSQVQHMVKILLNISGNLQADASDALAIALCHAHSDILIPNNKSRKNRSRGLNWSQYDSKLTGKISPD
jgi:crossover junction endodeoxyribonuclease RuvC